MAGNVLRHGFFVDDPQWVLDISEKDPGEQGTRPTIACPACARIYRGGRCVCGYEPTKKERAGQGLEFNGKELVEVKREEKPALKEKSAEQLMISALYMAGKSGRTWRQCVGIYKRLCEQQGTPHRVPASVVVAGKRYSMPRYGSDDSARKVGALFPFTVGQRHGGDYQVTETTSQEVMW